MKNDRRLFNRMIERQMPSALVAEKLNAKGYNVRGKDIFNIAMHTKKAPRQMQEDIADILGCLRRDIF